MIRELKYDDGITNILLDYINKQQSLVALILNALHSKWVAKKPRQKIVEEPTPVAKDYKFKTVDYCGYRLNLID